MASTVGIKVPTIPCLASYCLTSSYTCTKAQVCVTQVNQSYTANISRCFTLTVSHRQACSSLMEAVSSGINQWCIKNNFEHYLHFHVNLPEVHGSQWWWQLSHWALYKEYQVSSLVTIFRNPDHLLFAALNSPLSCSNHTAPTTVFLVWCAGQYNASSDPYWRHYGNNKLKFNFLWIYLNNPIRITMYNFLHLSQTVHILQHCIQFATVTFLP